MLEDVARVEDAPVAVAATVLDVAPAAVAVARLLEHALEVVAATVLHIALPPPAAVVTRHGAQILTVDDSHDSQSRFHTPIKNFSLSHKERTLDELIRDRWLSYTSTGKIGLGTRSFLDLQHWFCGNGLRSCAVCGEACIKVLICDDSMILASCFKFII